MTVTRLQRRRKRVRLKQTLRVKAFKKSMLKPSCKKVSLSEIEASFSNK